MKFVNSDFELKDSKIDGTSKLSRVILVRYGEIFLKSDPVFRILEGKLIKNIKEAFKKNGVDCKIERERGRIFIHTSQEDKACEILKNVFGIVSFSPCICLQTSEIEKIANFCKMNYDKWIDEDETFAVRVKRVGKHEYTSQQLADAIGKVIDRKVDLKNPDKEIFIEVRDDKTYIYTEVFKGLGGLPIDASGKVVSLISGGIDSPVASWLMMKRDCRVIYTHFHSFPVVSKASIYKTREIIKKLNKYQLKSKVYFVPLSDIQIYLKTRVPSKYLVILYRRFMVRIAEEICRKENAKAIVTGESLAQVASQTLESLEAIEEATTLPILRPLVGMDKSEIIELAKMIGTYEISIRPQEDCCQLFTPRHPTAKPKLSKIKEIEKNIPIEKLVKNALEKVEVEIID